MVVSFLFNLLHVVRQELRLFWRLSREVWHENVSNTCTQHEAHGRMIQRSNTMSSRARVPPIHGLK